MQASFKRALRITGAVAVLGIVAYAAGVAYDLRRSHPLPAAPADAGSTAQIARGLYVARAADCIACHTAPGGKEFAGGLALATPFGNILASNITQDKETGIGRWDLARFDRAVRHGQGRHGYLYPAMPYTAYARMSDADIADLWAFMRTVAPVSHSVEENALPFPVNQRWLLGGWNLLFFRSAVPAAAPADAQVAGSADYLRGAYLVNGAGHCAACHTAKNAFGGDASAYLQGGMVGGWYAPDLTGNARTGLGGWSVADIALYLKSGANAHSVSSGPMTEAIENSTQYLSDADLNAIGVYLKALPAGAAALATAPAGGKVEEAVMRTGKLVYESQCIACHVSDGKGVRRMIPSLAGNAQIQAAHTDNLMRAVLLGLEGPQTHANPTGAGMPRFDWRLSDGEVAAVLTYIRSSWGNQAAPVSEAAVRDARASYGAHAVLGARP